MKATWIVIIYCLMQYRNHNILKFLKYRHGVYGGCQQKNKLLKILLEKKRNTAMLCNE